MRAFKGFLVHFFQHVEICAFPSKQFYDGNLESPLHGITFDRHEKQFNFWPNKLVPLVFCHVEGAEKALTVSTGDGNQRSKSNKEEAAHAVNVI